MIYEETKPYLEQIKALIADRLSPKTKYRGHQIKSIMAGVYAQVLPFHIFLLQRSYELNDLLKWGIIRVAASKIKFYTKITTTMPAKYLIQQDIRTTDDQVTSIQEQEVAIKVTTEQLDKEILLELYLTVINDYRGDNRRGVNTSEYLKALESITVLLNRRVATFEGAKEPEEDDLGDTLRMLRSGELEREADKLC